jgi:PAS domain S-box-containing protein
MVEALPAVTYIDEPIPGDDLNAKMPFVSPQVEQILGYPRALHAGQPLLVRDHAPRRFRGDALGGHLSVANLDEVTEEYRMRHADGRWVWVQDTSRPVFDEQGELSFFQGFLVDVSTRHAAEERLREAEGGSVSSVERMPAMVYTEGCVPDRPSPRRSTTSASTPSTCSGIRPRSGPAAPSAGAT